MATVVLKIGGGAITDKQSQTPRLKDGALDLLREIIRRYVEGGSRIVLVTGAGSFGHALAKQYGLSSSVGSRNIQGALAVRRQVIDLTKIIERELAEFSIATLSPPWLVTYEEHSSSIRMDASTRQAIEQMWLCGAIPLFHGDLAFTDHGNVRILSGDVIAPLLADILNAEQLVFLSSCAVHQTGSSNSQVVTEISANEASTCKLANGSETTLESLFKSTAEDQFDVTGRMAGKVDSARAFVQTTNGRCEVTIAPLSANSLHRGNDITRITL